MIKIFILLLAFNDSNSSFEPVEFHTRQECEIALDQIKMAAKNRFDKKSIIGVCVEKTVPKKKMKCKIQNNFDYTNTKTCGHGSCVMNHYPYPESFVCEEE